MADDRVRRLELAATISSVASFMWIGAEQIALNIGEGTFGWSGAVQIVPFVVFIASMGFLWSRRRLRVEYHKVQSIAAVGAREPSSVLVEGRDSVDIWSGVPHFEVCLSGVFYGPELNEIRRRVKDEHPKVYAVVSEHDRPDASDLLWVQANEYGTLDSTGHYKVRAYLGGTGPEDEARDGEHFAIYILIPRDTEDWLERYPVYTLDAWPKSVYRSDRPVMVRTRRP